MSQFYINPNAVPPPPVVATSYVTDDGTAIPLANVLNVNALDSNEDNVNGIVTRANPDLSNNLEIVLTNRVRGTITTTDATPTTLISLPLGATPGVYVIEGNLVAFNVTDTAGGSYSFAGAARTTGVAATEIATEDKSIFEEAAMATADFTYGVTGNNAFLEVQGIAGKTINWSGLFTYQFVG